MRLGHVADALLGRSAPAAELLASLPVDGTWDPLGDYSAYVQPPAAARRASVTTDNVLGIPAAYRAIELSASTCAQLDVAAFKDGRQLRTQPALITQPDPWRQLDSWVERAVINYATSGENLFRVYRDGVGTVQALEVLDPFRTQVRWAVERGRAVKSYVTATRTGSVELADRDVIHSMLLEVPGHDRGLSPIEWCRTAVTGILDVRDYSQRWFAEEAVDGVLTSDQRLDATAAAEYRKRWYQRDANEPAGPRLRVLGQGLHYEAMSLKPEDAQWLQATNAGVLDVARMFGIPSNYLEAAVEGSTLTYQTLETLATQLVSTTLYPRYLRKLQGVLTSALPRGQRARFLTDELLRPDAKTRAEIDKTYVDMGAYDAAYVARREGWDDDDVRRTYRNTPEGATRA